MSTDSKNTTNQNPRMTAANWAVFTNHQRLLLVVRSGSQTQATQANAKP